MANEFQKLSGEYQRTGKEALVRSYGRLEISQKYAGSVFRVGGVFQKIHQSSN